MAPIFQSTLPVWGATVIFFEFESEWLDFNPRSPCGERLVIFWHKSRLLILFQSTLPVWGATNELINGTTGKIISIHAPRVGSDPRIRGLFRIRRQFQSTLPVWGATAGAAFLALCNRFQSTLPVWGATGK